MKIDCYLLIGAGGGIELRKTLPRQQRMDRVAVRLSITLSDAWFRRPIPLVALDIPDEAVLPLLSVRVEPAEGEANDDEQQAQEDHRH